MGHGPEVADESNLRPRWASGGAECQEPLPPERACDSALSGQEASDQEKLTRLGRRAVGRPGTTLAAPVAEGGNVIAGATGP